MFSNTIYKKTQNIRLNTTKLLEENIGRTLFDVNHSNIFFDPPLRVTDIKKINKWDLIKLKSFCTAQKIISKMKRQPMNWKKIFAYDVIDNRLIFKMGRRPK